MSTYIEIAEKLKQKADIVKEQAFTRIPKAYHEFIIFIDEHKKVSGPSQLTDEEVAYGLWSNHNGTFITVSSPYLQVNGLVQWARDDHREQKAKLHIHPATVCEKTRRMSIVVESEIYGISAGEATINSGISGYDDVNPIECAQTSCIGRALKFLGYGLIGLGIATAEEVEKSKKARHEAKQTSFEAKPSKAIPLQTEEVAATKEKIENDQGNSKSDKDSSEFRILALSDAQVNKDSTVFFEAMNLKKEKIQCLAPKNLREDAKNIGVDDVVVAYGWLNGTILKLDPRTTIVIEQKKKTTKRKSS